MAPIVSTTTWHGLVAWAIESETVRCVMVPGRGAKIASLVDKRSGLEWLIGPGSRQVKPLDYGSWWHEQDMTGWDEMFPTIIACTYPGAGPQHGAALPDHGEAWTLPWQVAGDGDGQVTMRLAGQALPYTLDRTAELPDAGMLRLHYRLTNLGPEPMPYIWASHPQFLCGMAAEIIFPPAVTAVINTIPTSWGWGAPETRFAWPAGTDVDGSPVRLDRVGPPTLHRGRKFFALPTAVASWAALRRSDASWLRFDWDADAIPYLGLWVDEGALNHASVATLEPTTGFYDNLQLAWDKGCVQMVGPGAVSEWDLTVTLGAGGQPA